MDQELADLVGQIQHFRMREVLQIGGPTDPFEHQASVRTSANSMRGPAEMLWWRPILTVSPQAAAS
jgi:hypothetical protein